MDRFDEIAAFVAVAETGGFARAAARLRSSPPAVTRAVAAMENRLGVRLFNRSTRRVHLTEAGLRFLERGRSLLADLDEAEKEAAGEASAPTGLLTVTASVTLGRSFLPAIMSGFLAAHPRVSGRVLLLDRIVDLVEEGVDIALRAGQLPDSRLIARQVGEVRRILVASPGYLARRGAPRTPAELKLHTVIAFTGLMPDRQWIFDDGGVPERVGLQPRLEINDAQAAIAAAVAGEGITITLQHIVAEEIRRLRLQPVLQPFWPVPVPVQLVYPESRLVAPKVRVFIDHATPRLRAVLEGKDVGCGIKPEELGLPAAGAGRHAGDETG